MEPKLKEEYDNWMQWDKNEKTRLEVENLCKENKFKELSSLLNERMVFGTAGLRAAMGGGFSRMNDLTIIQTGQGFVKYMIKSTPEVMKDGVIIGYDARHNSQRFAQLTAAIFLNQNIPVYLFSQICPTPFVAYGVLHKKCTWGIMVTASHNPKNDNGYKVYFKNGAQIISPHDSCISKSIEENLEPWDKSWDTSITSDNTLCQDPFHSVYDNYMKDLLSLSVSRPLNASTIVSFTYTAMHGVGYEFIVSAFKQFNFKPCIPVLQQTTPDPEFPTVVYPNPEEGKSALNMSIETANRVNSRYILANDPDADRLAVAEKQADGSWYIFNGNELGSLFGWWLIINYKQQQQNTDNVYVLASVVSTKLLKAIAVKEGILYEETLTGFKYMGNKSDELIKNGGTVLFAFEEAIGFMCGVHVLDKDGISAAMVMSELIVHLHENNSTLLQQLHKLNQDYGLHLSNNSYYICHDPQLIAQIFNKIRNQPTTNKYPEQFIFDSKVFTVKFVRDLTVGYDNARPNNIPILPVSKSSQMITFVIECDSMEGLCLYLTLRTSGTEPKIKYYSEFSLQPNTGNCMPSRLVKEELGRLLKQLVDGIVESLLQPTTNRLLLRQD